MATVAPEQEMLLDVRNPRTGRGRFPPAGFEPRRDRRQGRAAARQPARRGKRWASRARCGVMARWLGAVKARAMDIGEADAVDTGGCHTSYLQGFITMGNIAGWLEDAPKAFESLKWQGMSTSMPTVEIESQVVAYPIVGVISPWNAPLMLALLDAVPALFAGSAVLLKPSEVTPRVIETLFETVREVPELAAVFDYVTGPGEVGQAVIAEADTICFTGSVPTGRKVAVACAERLIPCNLELGGKDPCIVTASADLERAATAVLRGAVYATGQVCYSVERVYVHESVHDAFVAKLVEKARGRAAQRRQPARRAHRPVHFRPAGRDRAAPPRRCGGQGRDDPDRRRDRGHRRRALLAPDGADRRHPRHADHAGRDVRPVHPGDGLCRHRGSDPPRQRHPVRPHRQRDRRRCRGSQGDRPADQRRRDLPAGHLPDVRQAAHVRLGQLRLVGLRRARASGPRACAGSCAARAC